jgi:phenylpropionate dioxygenase-like ring-hydroxylating dioxygenase large terminal subunit
MHEQLVDSASRTVSGLAFSDPGVFAREQRTVFTRSWLYLGHRSQLRSGGDFIQCQAGTLPMLLCLDDEGQLHAFANVCSHRGSRICHVEHGKAEKFVCPYHNWVFSNRGDLLGVPRAAPPSFDKSRWGLHKAARVACHRDLVFATFSDDAPPLAEYLGEMRWYLDLLVGSSAAGTEVSGGSHRSRLHCNWKIPAEQFGADNWHFQAVHGSISKLGRRNEDPHADDSFHAWTPQGHMIICVAPRKEIPSTYSAYLDELKAQGQIDAAQRRLLAGTMVMTLFPNLSFVYFPGMCAMRVWQPRSAGETEMWSWALVNRDLPEALKDSFRKQVTRLFSPTGMLEQDDLEVWARLGGNLAAMPPDFRLCYAFDAEDTPRARPYPGQTASLQSDRAAFAFYESWARALSEPVPACR